MKCKIVFRMIMMAAAVALVAPVSASTLDDLYVTISDNKLYERFSIINPDYPLLSYEDATYIAVRDATDVYNREVIWDEEEQSITIERKPDYMVIEFEETALEIGKALLESYFGYNGECAVKYGYEEMYRTELWRIDAADEDGTVNGFVLIDAYTGQFGVYESTPEGNKEIVSSL